MAAAALPLAISSCAPALPPIAQPAGDARFKALIAERYPAGTPGARLRADLAAQGFLFIDDPAGRAYSAVDRPANLPCFSETRVDWREDRRGRITVIQAARHVCS